MLTDDLKTWLNKLNVPQVLKYMDFFFRMKVYSNLYLVLVTEPSTKHERMLICQSSNKYQTLEDA